jgi:1-acyl-sn-glycerol-3-phosphate acyltransferase
MPEPQLKLFKRNRISVLFGLLGVVLTFAAWSIALILRRILFLPIRYEDLLVDSCARTIARCLQVKILVVNREIYDGNEPAIIIANHSSYVDVSAVQLACTGRLRMLAKRELFYFPFLGWAMWAAHFVGVNRGKKRSASRATQTLTKHLAKGYQIFLFPEGTRGPGGCILPFKSGAFRIAAEAQVPIYVLALREPWKIMPRTKYLPNMKGEIESKFLGKILPKNGENRVKTPDELMNEARKLYFEAGFKDC